MYIGLQVFFVLMVYGLPCLAENENTTNTANGSFDATSTKAVTSQHTLTRSTTTPVSPSTTLLITSRVTSTPTSAVGDDSTTVPKEISGKSTTQNIITNGTEDGDVTQVNHDVSTTSAAGKGTVDESSSPVSPCSHCPTPDVSSEHQPGKSLKETTVTFHNTSGIQHTATDSVPTSATHDKVPGSSDTPRNLTSTTEQSLKNHDTTVSSNSETSSAHVSTVPSDSPADTSKMPASSSREGTAHHPESNARPQPTPPVHLSVLGVLAGVVCALVIVLAIIAIFRRVRDSGKKKMLLNKDANRLDMMILRRFTINDVKASLGGIPANGDIWHEMNKNSSIVV